MRLYGVHPMIGHRTNEGAKRPRYKCEQDDAATEATDSFGSMGRGGVHSWIIRVRRCRVNDLKSAVAPLV
jgi:hypothetical protein